LVLHPLWIFAQSHVLMGRKISVRKLSGDELSFLERASKGKNYTMKARAQMILLSKNEGLSARKIARRLGVHRHTVEDRINRFNESGIEGLKDIPPPGRPPKITEEEKETIFKTALGKPNEFGLPYSSWSARKLRDYLIGKDLIKHEICPEWVRKLLKKRDSNSSGQQNGLLVTTQITRKRRTGS
jgi:transposase